MKFSQRLLPRIALPVVGLMVLSTLSAVVVLWAFHNSLVLDEMERLLIEFRAGKAAKVENQ